MEKILETRTIQSPLLSAIHEALSSLWVMPRFVQFLKANKRFWVTPFISFSLFYVFFGLFVLFAELGWF